MLMVVKLLLACALLWQSVGPVAAAAIDCCAIEEPCCVSTTHASHCSTCVPVAAGAPLVDGVVPVEARSVRSVSEPLALIAAPLTSIWRPPMPDVGSVDTHIKPTKEFQ